MLRYSLCDDVGFITNSIEAHGSDNSSAAENQQERLMCNIRILRDYTPNANDLFVGEDIVPSAWRHAGANVKGTHRSFYVIDLYRKRSISEIPCRVSSDLHEWRNAGHTVSTRDSVKLKSL
jgi:hypothetical protein